MREETVDTIVLICTDQFKCSTAYILKTCYCSNVLYISSICFKYSKHILYTFFRGKYNKINFMLCLINGSF